MACMVTIRKGGARPPRVIWIPSRHERIRAEDLAPRMWSAALVAGAAVDRAAGYPVSHARPGRSPATAAAQHVGYCYTLAADLSAAYDRCTAAALESVAGRDLADAAYMLARSVTGGWVIPAGCVRPDVAPQGLCSSAAVAEAALVALDRAVLAWLRSRAAGGAWRYTRYADDVSVSSDDRALLEALRAALPDIARSVGHEIARDKVALLGGGGARRVICGVSVGAADVAAPRRTRRELRAAAHRLVLMLRDAAAVMPVSRDWSAALLVAAQYQALRTRGLAEWCSMRRPDSARAARRMLDRGGEWLAAARAVVE